jgi:hypothetical protein
LRKISAAKYCGIKLAHFLRTGEYVGGEVLAVSVRGYRAKTVWAIFCDVFECGFERGALASVYLVYKHGAMRHRANLVKDVLVCLSASVINYANVREAGIKYALYGAEKLFIGLI